MEVVDTGISVPPLAVMSTYAQMAEDQVRRGVEIEQTIDDLRMISVEFERLAEINTFTPFLLSESAHAEYKK